MKLQNSKFHFVGIGGIGMCGLAEILHNMGAQVSGSDLSENANTEHLREIGVRIFIGHRSENVSDVDVLVYSSAIKMTNPEVAEARKRKIPLIPRAEALAEIMRLKRGVAIAGTHGKTTTTSLTSSIFLTADLKPTIAVGGRFDLIKSTALLGDGPWLIAEADESDGSFHKLSPEIAVITNIDADHLDHFKSFENLQKSFYDFALKIPFYGSLVACGDDSIIRQVFENYPKKILFYGFSEENDFFIKGHNGHYDVFQNHSGQVTALGSFNISVPGRHNALNALAALVVALQAGISFQDAVLGLARYQGVDRRFHFKGSAQGVLVYDDYGHHPTEVKAALQAFRENFPNKKLIVYFQPHRFSRTESCWHDFLTSFALADQVYLGDIYSAGEAPIPGITSQRMAAELKHSFVEYLPKQKMVAQEFIQKLPNDSVFVTLGAGDGWKFGMSVLEELNRKT